MILQVNNKDAAALVLHLKITRKNFKNLLKSKYSADRKRYLNAYDYVVAECAEVLEQELDNKDLHLNIVDLSVLAAFLKAYVSKANEEFEKAKIKDDEGHIQTLQNIQQECERLIKDAA